MRLDLYCEQTGQSQAAGGFANGITAILGGCKFSADSAEMEGNTILRLGLSQCEGGMGAPKKKVYNGKWYKLAVSQGPEGTFSLVFSDATLG